MFRLLVSAVTKLTFPEQLSVLIYFFLWLIWMLYFRKIAKEKPTLSNTGFSDNEELKKYKREIVRPIDWGLFLNFVAQALIFIFLPLDSSLIYVVSVVVFYVIFWGFLAIFMPRVQAVLKYRHYIFSTDSALRVWNYYAFKSKKLSNKEIWKKIGLVLLIQKSMIRKNNLRNVVFIS